MSCDSQKCDVRKALQIPPEPNEATPEDRELIEPRSPEEEHYAVLWSETELQKPYPPERWREVKGKKHG